MLTPARRAELRKLSEEATSAPWRWVQVSDYYVMTNSADDGQPYPQILSDGSACGEYGADIDPRGPDGQIVPAARNALPELLDAVEEMERDAGLLRRADDAAGALAKLLGREIPEPKFGWAAFDLPEMVASVEGMQRRIEEAEAHTLWLESCVLELEAQRDAQRWVSVAGSDSDGGSKMRDSNDNRRLFEEYTDALTCYQGALQQDGVVESICREEMREAFDAYIAARFGITPQPEREKDPTPEGPKP